MNSKAAIAGVLTLALLVTVGALGYKVIQQFLRFQASEKLFKEIYSPEYIRPEKDVLKPDIERIRAARKEYGGDRLDAMLVDRLAGVVWLYPDEANAALSEIFELTPALTESADLCPLVQASNYMQVWAFQCAILPELVERDADVVVAKQPRLRQTVRTLQAYTRLMNDDFEGLEELAQQELASRNNSMDARGFALACKVLQGDYPAALEYEDSAEKGIWDVNIKILYVDLLVQQQRFEEAQKWAQEFTGSGSSSELAFSLAVPTYYLKGPNHILTRQALESMTKSARNPMSKAGAEAWVLGRLYEVTGKTDFAQRLAGLSKQYPRDYDVWAAQADCLMNRSMWLDDKAMNALLTKASDQSAAGPGQKSNATPSQQAAPLGSGDIARASREALATASTEAQILQSELIAARSELYGTVTANTSQKQNLLDHFRASLSPDEKSGEPRNRIPDYDMLLTDLRMRKLRESDSVFSSEVHSIVEGFVERRVEYFKPAMEQGEAARLAYIERLHRSDH